MRAQSDYFLGEWPGDEVMKIRPLTFEQADLEVQ